MNFKESELKCKKCNHNLLVTEDGEIGLCPICHTFHLIRENGNVIIPAKKAECPKCKSTYLIPEENKVFHCPQCNNDYVISDSGDFLIKRDLFIAGELGQLKYTKKKDHIVALQNKWTEMPRRSKNTIIGAIAACILCLIGLYIWSLPADIEGTLAYADMGNVWKEFRAKNPYNFQSIGLKKYSDNSYVCIVSEPSDNITLDDLKDFFDSYNCSYTVQTQKMGYDGWLKDAVFCFNDLSESNIPKFASKLNKLLYGTDYKASLLDLNNIPEHVPFSTHNLNYQISEEELNTWFVKNKEPLVELEDSTEETNLETVLGASDNESDLYMSKKPGFIVWVLNESSTLDAEDFRIKARKFSIDSDLILGAISNGTRVAIIARERTIPIYELPPMRQETMMLLAATDKEELSQSYERNNMFAGKLPGGKDFAPILLSNELWHTEYGSILNVTDQMLKSWSENGDIEYHGFNYPKPIDWAFNNGVVHDLGVDELTYNWNTSGAGYVVENENGISIYAVNRTGSLPISYIPGETDNITEFDPVYQAEERAYDFYSELNSPELVKVVQYASLYQIFTNFDVHIDKDNKYVKTYDDTANEVDNDTESETESNDTILPINTPSKLYEYAEVVFDSISNLNPGSKRKIIEYEIAKVSKFHKYSKFENQLFGLWSGLEIYGELDTLHSVFSQIDQYSVLGCLSHSLVNRDAPIQYSEPSASAISATQIDPSVFNLNTNLSESSPQRANVTLPDGGTEEKIGYAMSIMYRHQKAIQSYAAILGVCSLNNALKLYVEANKNKSSNWIKCPTIVLSWQKKDSVTAVGGHNLNSNITPIKINKSLKPGEYKVTIDKTTGKKIVEISAKDKAKVTPDFLRKAQRTNLIGKHDNLVEVRPVRARDIVLNETEHRTARGFNVADHITIKQGKVKKFSINGKEIDSASELLKEFSIALNASGRAPFKTVEFDMISENKVTALVDNVRQMVLTKGSEIKLQGNDYDWGGIVTEKSPSNPNKVIVKIPIKAKSINAFGTQMTIKAGMHEFEIPSGSVSSFISELKLFFKNPNKYWERTKFKYEYHKAKKQRLDEKETIMMKVARVLNLKHDSYDLEYIQEEVA